MLLCVVRIYNRVNFLLLYVYNIMLGALLKRVSFFYGGNTPARCGGPASLLGRIRLRFPHGLNHAVCYLCPCREIGAGGCQPLVIGRIHGGNERLL